MHYYHLESIVQWVLYVDSNYMQIFIISSAPIFDLDNIRLYIGPLNIYGR